jgi:predicted membrane channel-forming protein YqfA (hemolysin III family)
MVSILATICTIMTVQTGFRSPSFRAFRSAMYAGLGLSFIVPIVHGISVHGFEVQMWRMSLDWMLLMASFNLTGAVIYALRVRVTPVLGNLFSITDCVTDSRKVVSQSSRYLWSKPSNTPFRRYLCWVGAYVWLTPRL